MPALPSPSAVSIYHLGTTAGSTQTYTLAGTFQGTFLPLDRKEHALEGGDYNIQWELYLDPSVDVRVADKVVIDGTNYYVKFIFPAVHFGRLRHKRVSLSSQA